MEALAFLVHVAEVCVKAAHIIAKWYIAHGGAQSTCTHCGTAVCGRRHVMQLVGKHTEEVVAIAKYWCSI
jgi:hypothetical protein